MELKLILLFLMPVRRPQGKKGTCHIFQLFELCSLLYKHRSLKVSKIVKSNPKKAYVLLQKHEKEKAYRGKRAQVQTVKREKGLFHKQQFLFWVGFYYFANLQTYVYIVGDITQIIGKCDMCPFSPVVFKCNFVFP